MAFFIGVDESTLTPGMIIFPVASLMSFPFNTGNNVLFTKFNSLSPVKAVPV